MHVLVVAGWVALAILHPAIRASENAALIAMALALVIVCPTYDSVAVLFYTRKQPPQSQSQQTAKLPSQLRSGPTPGMRCLKCRSEQECTATQLQRSAIPSLSSGTCHRP